MFEPCGTPVLRVAGCDFSELTNTTCDLFFNYEAI